MLESELNVYSLQASKRGKLYLSHLRYLVLINRGIVGRTVTIILPRFSCPHLL